MVAMQLLHAHEAEKKRVEPTNNSVCKCQLYYACTKEEHEKSECVLSLKACSKCKHEVPCSLRQAHEKLCGASKTIVRKDELVKNQTVMPLVRTDGKVNISKLQTIKVLENIFGGKEKEHIYIAPWNFMLYVHHVNKYFNARVVGGINRFFPHISQKNVFDIHGVCGGVLP